MFQQTSKMKPCRLPRR